MNVFELLSSPVCLKLALALLHFLWQGAVLGAAAAVLVLLFGRNSARARYGIYMGTLFTMALCVGLTFAMVDSPIAKRSSLPAPEVATPAQEPIQFPTTSSARTERPDQVASAGTAPAAGSPAGITAPQTGLRFEFDWERYAPLGVGVYLAGVLAMLARFLIGYQGGQRLRRHSEPVEETQLLESLTRMAQRIGLAAAPAIAYCGRVAVPTVVGVFKPTILLPLSFATGLSTEQVELLLCHELAHIKRWDPLCNVLQRVLEALLFFHPAVWYVSRRIRIERENCCDDIVLATGGDSLEYASSLIETARKGLGAALPLEGLSATGRPSQLRGRVLRMMGDQPHESVRLRHAWLLVGSILLGSSIVFAVSKPAENESTSQIQTTVQFTCLDKKGAPVPGAEVYLVQMTADSFPAEEKDMKVATLGPVVSDSQGVARFEELPRVGPVFQRSVYARVPGQSVGVGMQMKVPMAPDVHGSTEVVMIDSKDLSGRVSVPAGYNPAKVRVRVLGVRVEDGKTQHGAMFDRHSEGTADLWPEVFEVNPDAQGDFTILDAPTEGMIYLAAEGPGLGQSQFYTAGVASTDLVSMTMLPEAMIEGTLLYEHTNEPANGITIKAYPEPGGGHIGVILPFEATTQEDGTFRIEELPEGIFTVAVPVEQQPSEWNVAVQIVQTKIGETVSGIELRMEKGALITGMVTDSETGSPIGKVQITALNPGEPEGHNIGFRITDEEGRYSIRLPKGESMLYFMAIPREKYEYPPDQGKRIVKVEEGHSSIEDIDFELKPRTAPQWKYELGKATGRVLDQEGNPIAHAGIADDRVYNYDGAERMEGSNVGVTGDDGRFEVDILAGATHELIVGGGRFTVTKTPEFYLESEEVHDVGDVRVLPATSSISGVVVSPEGAPIPNARIHVGSELRRGYGLYPDIVTDEKGSFHADGVYWKDDDLSVVAMKTGYQMRNLNGVLPGSRDVRFVLFSDDDPLHNPIGKSIPDAKHLVGQEAPDWDVETWLQGSEDASLGPKRTDGKKTVLLYAMQYAEWPQVFTDLVQFESICEENGCVPVVLFSCATDPSVPNLGIEQNDLTLAMAIDRFDPYSEYSHPAATLARYGSSKECGKPPIFIIDSTGEVKHVQYGLNGLAGELESEGK